MSRSKSKKIIVAEPHKIAENLRKIYENSDGTMPDMKTFERSNGVWFWRLLTWFFVFCGFGILGWIVWGYTTPNLIYNDQISVAVEAPLSVASGDSITYTVHYKNAESTPIAHASLSFQYPRGFVFVSSSPSVLGERSTIVLGSIPAGSSGTVILTGKLMVDQFTTSTLTAVLSYTPSNFNSVFEKVANFQTVASIPAATINWNQSTALNENLPTTLSFIIQPTRSFPEPVVITVQPDPSFSGQAIKPDSDEPDIFRWTLPKLSNMTTFTIHGVFSGANINPRFLTRISGKSFVYTETETNFTLTSSTMKALASVFGNTEETKIRPGQTLPISLSFQNSSDIIYPNLTAVLYIDAPSYQKKSILDWQNLIDHNNGAVKGEQINDLVRRGTILWENDPKSQLNNFFNGGKSIFNLSLPIKDGANTSFVNFGTSTVTLWGEIRSNGEVLATSNKVNVKILSDLSLKASATNDFGVQNFSLLLENSFHDLKNVTVSTTLLGDVLWDEQKLNVPAGTVVFSENTNVVTWTIKEMPASLDSLAMEFGATMKNSDPTENNYTGSIFVNATDAETHDLISFTVDPIGVE